MAGSSSSSYAYGAVFAPGQYRTIMAYSSRGERRVNYYSGPGVRYHEVGDRGIGYIHILDTICSGHASTPSHGGQQE